MKSKRKPKIFKKVNKWCLFYWFQPRQFSLFGADVEQRERIYEASNNLVFRDSFIECLDYLKLLYKERLIQRH